MAKHSPKHRFRRLLGLAALGAFGAWLVRRLRSQTREPEGTWRAMEVSDTPER